MNALVRGVILASMSAGPWTSGPWIVCREHHVPAGYPHRVQIGDERKGRHDHLIARAYATGQHRDVQGCSSICDRKALAALAQLLGIGIFEVESALPHGNPP
jgi:hypothetical protein